MTKPPAADVRAPDGSEKKDGPDADGPGFDRHMLEALVCPRSQTTLEYDADRQELISRKVGLRFPIRNGIPVLLIDEALTMDAD